MYMSTEVHTLTEVLDSIEDKFNSMLSRYFTTSCTQTTSGDLLCTFSYKNIRFPIRNTNVRMLIKRQHADNYEYVSAVVTSAVHQLFNKVLKS